MQNHTKKWLNNHNSTNAMAAIAIGAMLVFSAAGMKGAFADTIENTIAADVTRNTIDAGGSTTATYYVKVESAREEGTGGANACNADSVTPLFIDVNFPSAVKAKIDGSEKTSPITLKFEGCGEGKGHQITFTSDTAGSYQITTNNIEDDGVGLYTDNSDFTLTVRAPSDTTKPELNLPSDITEEATGPEGRVITYTATATDNGKDIEVNCTPASGSTFKLGETTVNCSATDAAGNEATGSFKVTITPPADRTAPELNLPSDITEEATGPGGAAITYTATATDNVDGDVEVTCEPPSGSTFKLGETTVNCSATDAAQNTATGSFTVTVQDTKAPTLQLPSDITEEATGPGGAAITYTATATDNVDGDVEVTCEPPSGSTFKLGETTVNCSATDAAQNTATGSFTVTVQDTKAPTLQLPSDITEEATGPGGAAITYTATATDNVDGDVEVTCEPPSGSTFKLGETTVNCSATDAAQNTATGSFTVTVQDTKAPTLTLPADISQKAKGASGNTITYTATATDIVDGTVTVTCTPASGSTFPIGTTTVNCSVKDAAGNEATGSFKIAVTITAQGFYQPVDNLPTLNSAKAGQTIPIKFEVFGESEITATSVIVQPLTYKKINCDGSAPSDAIETVATGSTVLRYDSTAGQFIYNWKTPNAKGCYEVNISLIGDMGTKTARFDMR